MKKITECILYNVIILHYYMDPIFSGHQHSFQSNLLLFFACLNVNYLHLFLGLQIPRSLSHLQRGSLCFWLKWHSFLSLDLWILYLMFSCLSFLIGIGDSFLPKKPSFTVWVKYALAFCASLYLGTYNIISKYNNWPYVLGWY